MDAPGNIKAIYPILGVNVVVAVLALWVLCVSQYGNRREDGEVRFYEAMFMDS